MSEGETLLITKGTEVSIEEPHANLLTEAEQGPQGIQGEKGDKGDKGDPGLAGASFPFVQSTALAVWTITHNLNRFPSVVTVDSSGDTVEGEVKYLSSNEVQVTFCAPFGGTAYLN